MSFKEYNVYKESNIEWIGKIPKHWKVIRFKDYFEYEKGKNPSSFLDEPNKESLPYVEMSYLRGNGDDVKYAKFEEKLVQVNDNDILLLWDGSKAGEFLISKRGYLGSTLAKFSARNNNNLKFIYYIGKSIQTQLQELTNGMGIPHVDSKILTCFRVPYLDNKEQVEISNFLDLRIKDINSVMKNKLLHIDILKEYEKILINEVVIRGINEKVELIESGLDWIGKIPKHWNLKKVKHIVDLANDKTNKIEDINKYIALENIQSAIGKLIPAEEEIEVESMVNHFQKEDVLFCKLRPYLRKFYFCEFDGYCCSELLVFRKYKADMRYFYYLIQSDFFISRVDGSTYGAKMPRASPTFIINERVPVPPLPEQRGIADYLDKKTSQIRKSIKFIKKELLILEEYKEVLINESITGKIKVS